MTKEEKCLWLASANAAPYVSDDAIRTKEDAAAAIYYRRSISSEASDPWFAPRLHRLRTRPTAGSATPASAAPHRTLPRWPALHLLPRSRPLDLCGAGHQGPYPQGQVDQPWQPQHTSAGVPRPDGHLPRSRPHLLTARPPMRALGVTSMASLCPARLRMQIPQRGGFGFPPGAKGTRFWRRPAAGCCPPVEGRSRAPSAPLPHHHVQGRGAAQVGGRRALTLAPSGAAGGGAGAKSCPPSASGATLTAQTDSAVVYFTNFEGNSLNDPFFTHFKFSFSYFQVIYAILVYISYHVGLQQAITLPVFSV